MSRPSSDPVDGGLRRLTLHVLRALRLRCPNCGGGPLFTRWVRMARACPRCHLVLDRGEADHFIGGYIVNFVTAEFAIALGALAAVLATWPDVPWNTIKWTLLVLMVPLPILTYPFAKALWLAIDLAFRPITWGDLAGHGENESGSGGAGCDEGPGRPGPGPSTSPERRGGRTSPHPP